ncbi:hypothetical protein [Nonomuraea sp. NPDC048916]|uniref:hypothetical protein n=1 Tax=Nonomuraea sp. NPDC048916 TaxID=3154232 RepID=UPI0033E5CC81
MGQDEPEYRSPWGTGCCYAGHLALAAGSQWLVDIQGDWMSIDGTPVTATDHESVPFSLWQYMLATVDDPQRRVFQVRGKPVIHVAHRAAHLIGLNPDGEHDSDDDGLFAPGNTREDLERLITEQVGPRP